MAVNVKIEKLEGGYKVTTGREHVRENLDNALTEFLTKHVADMVHSLDYKQELTIQMTFLREDKSKEERYTGRFPEGRL